MYIRINSKKLDRDIRNEPYGEQKEWEMKPLLKNKGDFVL